MISQKIPLAEIERIIDLQALGILDTPPEERFDRITRIAQRVFDVPIAVISLVDEDRQWFKSKIGMAACETPRESSFCTHAIEGDGVLHVVDAAADDRFNHSPLVTTDPKIRFYAGCPIESPDGNKLGTLCVIDHQPRRLCEDELQTLRDLAAMVEEEVAAARLATTDSLTRLRNRRGFFLVARQVLRFAKRMAKPACLLYADIDDMKYINDELGHNAGDQALIDVAYLLRECFRESDVIARLGGDEYCVLLSGSSALEAEKALFRLHACVARLNAEGAGPELSLSVGLADWEPASRESLEELMKRADAEMYAHKKSKEI